MFEDLTLFAMAKRSLNFLARRQEVLSQNVANANSPDYKAKDLEPLNFKDLFAPGQEPIRAVTTNEAHVSPPAEPVQFQTVTEDRPEESKPNGNQVLLEEQMQKIGEVKDNYQLAVNLYQANLAMLKTAIGSQ